MTQQEFRAVIDKKFGGVLRAGIHAEGSQACALEAYAVATGQEWTDSPAQLEIPDPRPFNDGPWSSDVARTEEMIPLIAALSEWRGWPYARQRKWAECIAIRTVREIIAALPGLLPPIAAGCREAVTIVAAYWAASHVVGTAMAARPSRLSRPAMQATVQAAAMAAEAAAETAATKMAAAAAGAVQAAARAANATGRSADDVLRQACRIWIEEAMTA